MIRMRKQNKKQQKTKQKPQQHKDENEEYMVKYKWICEVNNAITTFMAHFNHLGETVFMMSLVLTLVRSSAAMVLAKN